MTSGFQPSLALSRRMKCRAVMKAMAIMTP